jgi:hypothetical protein
VSIADLARDVTADYGPSALLSIGAWLGAPEGSQGGPPAAA